MIFLTENNAGNLICRIVDVSPVISWSDTMPPAVVAIDLMQSNNPRERLIGMNRLEELL
jgi:hypothetical protein